MLGYPLTEESAKAGLREVLASASRADSDESCDSVVLLTHVGPAECDTSEYAKDSHSSISTGSHALREILKESEQVCGVFLIDTLV